MPEKDYDLKCRFSFKQTEKEQAETEKAKMEAAVTAIFLPIGEMREMIGKDPGPDADKYLMELEAEANKMGIAVTGLEGAPTRTPPPEEKPTQTPGTQDSTEDDCMRREIAKCKDKPHDQAVAIAAKKCGISKDSFLEKWPTRSLNEKMRLIGAGRGTIKKMDSLIDLVNRDAVFATHQSSFLLKTDSMIENEEYYIIDCNCFDAQAKLKYVKEDGSVSIERNPPEEIEKWVLTNKGKQFDLGITHEVDGSMVVEHGIGFVIPNSFDGRRDHGKAHVLKKKIAKYPYVHEMIKYEKPLELSAAYGCLDVDSTADGFHADHVNLDVRAVVITAGGRCNDGGGTCEITPN